MLLAMEMASMANVLWASIATSYAVFPCTRYIEHLKTDKPNALSPTHIFVLEFERCPHTNEVLHCQVVVVFSSMM